MLTGHADMEAAISGMAMGAFDYLMKPADLDDLVRKLREAGQRSRKLGEGSGLE
jgi:ActR/RegA family two-component response regulator